MKIDGNYRTEKWTRGTESGEVLTSEFVVDDEQVTIEYGLWADILTELGFTKAAK